MRQPADAAKHAVTKMAEQLLANPVIEQFEISTVTEIRSRRRSVR